MNAGRIDSANSWSQFVRLAQEARIRNQGLSASAAARPAHAAQQSFKAVASGQIANYGKTYAPAQPMQQSSQVQEKRKTVGTLFDSYA